MAHRTHAGARTTLAGVGTFLKCGDRSIVQFSRNLSGMPWNNIKLRAQMYMCPEFLNCKFKFIADT